MLKILKASAGSGKTYNLAREYIRLLMMSERPDAYRHVLAVTFTNKATDEMKRRILKELNQLAKDPAGSPYRKDLEKLRAKQTKLKSELNKCNTQYEKLNEEIANTLIGESIYSPQQLSLAMNKVQQNKSAIESQIKKIDDELEYKKNAMSRIKPMYEQFKGWAEEFDLLPTRQKKMIISNLVKRIEVGKGYKIKLQLNMDYEQFCEEWA